LGFFVARKFLAGFLAAGNFWGFLGFLAVRDFWGFWWVGVFGPQAKEPAWHYFKPQSLHGITSSLRACMALPQASEPAWHKKKPI